MDPGGLPESRAQAGQQRPIRLVMATVKLLLPVLKHVTSVMRPTADAARDLVAVAVGPEFDGRRGYFVGQKPDVDAEISRDTKSQQRLWAACWKWSGLTSSETVLSNVAG